MYMMVRNMSQLFMPHLFLSFVSAFCIQYLSLSFVSVFVSVVCNCYLYIVRSREPDDQKERGEKEDKDQEEQEEDQESWLN